MSKTFLPVWMVLLLSVLGSCQKKEAPPAEPQLSPAQKRVQLIENADAETLMDMGYKQIEAVFRILRDNQDDCKRALKTVSGFAEEHRAEIRLIGKHYRARKKALPPERQKKLKDKMRHWATELIQPNVNLLVELSKNCPEQMAEFGKALQIFNDFGK